LIANTLISKVSGINGLTETILYVLASEDRARRRAALLYSFLYYTRRVKESAVEKAVGGLF
jgi:hypothetical protein